MSTPRHRTPAAPAAVTSRPVAEGALVVTSHKVACDGSDFSKHPRVYLNLGTADEAICPYCSRHFIFVAKGDQLSLKLG